MTSLKPINLTHAKYTEAKDFVSWSWKHALTYAVLGLSCLGIQYGLTQPDIAAVAITLKIDGDSAERIIKEYEAAHGKPLASPKT